MEIGGFSGNGIRPSQLREVLYTLERFSVEDLWVLSKIGRVSLFFGAFRSFFGFHGQADFRSAGAHLLRPVSVSIPASFQKTYSAFRMFSE
jgi:hypothetical protein